ncbi:hypothetical protein ACH49_02685 [Streptomyces leeuwenhoekii]|uniref:TetR Family Transcriptional Regulator n=1 Tax=Streptomyces leeuwenhoekii TaxID=1437453 RepID=A0ABR5I4V1_STRLW|nr:hypothetical protein ACH49_02685 [Streptomyces leeuwenhoekii]
MTRSPYCSRSPSGTRLHDLIPWLEQQLCTHYPALAAERDGSTRARALLEHRLVLPLLDGFDEMAPAAQAVALDAIRPSLRPVQQNS